MDGVITFQELIVGGGILSIAGFAIGAFVKINNVKEENDKKIGRAYQHIDEVKNNLKKEMVNEKVCDEIHKAANEKLNCIPEIKETVIKINERVNLLLKKNNINVSDG